MKKIIVLILLVAVLTAVGVYFWQTQDEDNAEKVVGMENPVVGDMDISEYLPDDATNIQEFTGDFDGDDIDDIIVLYELEDKVINDKGTIADKQFLETYLYSESDGKFEQFRTDEGTIGVSYKISEPTIVDFDDDGDDEVLVVKVLDGTGHYISYYVMDYRSGGMADVPIDKSLKNANVSDDTGWVYAEDNSLKRKIQTYTETDPNCCPTGPEIYVTWNFVDGEFVVANEETVYSENKNREKYENAEYGFSFEYPNNLDIDDILAFETYEEVSEPGPGQFYINAAFTRWTTRLANRENHEIGDSCTKEEIFPAVQADPIECTIVSTEPLYVIKYIDAIKDSYIIVTDEGEFYISVDHKKPKLSGLIGETLMY